MFLLPLPYPSLLPSTSGPAGISRKRLSPDRAVSQNAERRSLIWYWKRIEEGFPLPGAACVTVSFSSWFITNDTREEKVSRRSRSHSLFSLQHQITSTRAHFPTLRRGSLAAANIDKQDVKMSAARKKRFLNVTLRNRKRSLCNGEGAASKL